MSNQSNTGPKWKVHVFGESDRELSVIRVDDKHGQKSYGWYGDTKILIGRSGHRLQKPVLEFLWKRHMRTARALCKKLNTGTL